MKRIMKPLAVFLAVLMAFSVAPVSFAAVDTESIVVGDTVSFGKYDQDNKPAEVEEALNWIVVAKNESVLTLITKDCINSSNSFATARNKTGKWGIYNKIYTNFLSDFVDDAFTEKEKAAIVAVDNGAVDKNDEPTGVLDLVYLPSIAEVESFFPVVADRIANNTAVSAKIRGASPAGTPSKWYVRDEAYQKSNTAVYCNYISETGEVVRGVDSQNVTVTTIGTIAVRLVVNIDISKLFTTGKDAETGITPLAGTLGTYNVTWLDSDGTVMKTEKVDHGDPATVPSNLIYYTTLPAHHGSEFTGWDKTFDSITSDTVITAIYEEIPEDSLFMQVARWIWSMLQLLAGIVKTELLPKVNEWLSENLNFTIPVDQL